MAMERELCGNGEAQYYQHLFASYRYFRLAMADPSLVPHIDPVPNFPNYVYPDPRYP